MSCVQRCAHICLLLVAACCPLFALASPVAELQANGSLQIRSTLSPGSGIVPGQRVALTLEIATDRWFSGGTRITIPEVPGLVILQNEQFASNASETRGGQTWVIQRWTLDVFPQRAGEFTIPPIKMQVQVNVADVGDVDGELTSPATRFAVVIPQSLAQAEHWVAAPEFEVEQSFDRSLDDLGVGDSFEQTILFSASDLMAMMLPGYEIEQLPGLAAYLTPAVLENSANRGQTRATRSTSISYVVESPGQFLLPARDYFWWNTDSGELVLVSLPETRIDVAGGSAARSETARPFAITPRRLGTLVVALTLFALVLRLAWIILPRLPLAQWRTALSGLYSRLRALRKPALASRLNPGNNAAE